MLVQSQSYIAQDHVERLTAESPLLTAKDHPLFAPFVKEGKLAPNKLVARRRTLVSPLAGGIVRSVIVNSFTSLGQKILYQADNHKFYPFGRIIVHIGESPFEAGQERLEPWIRSAFQYDITAQEPNDWTVHAGDSDGQISSEICSIAADELENWGMKATILGPKAMEQSVKITPWPNYEYCVNYQLSVLE